MGAPDFKYLDFDLAMWDWVPGMDPDFILSVLGCDQYGSRGATPGTATAPTTGSTSSRGPR